MGNKRLGKYEILEEIGSGGMGVVYRARHIQLNRIAALKAIRERYSTSDRHLERFKREAAVCAQLNHPNVIKLFDYGEDNGTCFYAMEFIDAETLKEKITERSPQSGKFILHVGRHLAEALRYIHGEGVLHRDIKPANIMVAKDSHITLMDFGLVKTLQQEGLTQAGKAIGTPRYMSPEMLKAEEVDGRSDIFQLGIVLYEMATGSTPFKGKDVYSIAAKLLSKAPPRPSKLNPRLGIWLETLILNCLEKDKEDRYQSAEELISDIDKCEKRIPIKRRGKEPDDDELDKKSLGSSSGTGHFTLAFSGVDLSTISTSVHRLRTAITPKHIAIIIILAATIAYGLFNFCQSDDGTYAALDVTIEYDIDSVLVKWRSHRPYPTAINLWPMGRSTERQEIKPGDEPKATIDHELELAMLKRGLAHQFEVLYPNGKKSLSHTIDPLQHDRLATTSFRVERETFSSLALSFQTNVPAKSSVTFVRKKGKDRIEVNNERKSQHRCLIENIGPTERLTDLTIDLQSRRHKQTLNMGHIKSPAIAVDEFAKIVATFDISHLHGKLKKAKKKSDGEKVLDGYKFWRIFMKNRKLATSYMQNWSRLPLVKTMELYRVLRKIDGVDAFLQENKLSYDFDIKSTFSTFLETTYSKERPKGKSLLIFALDEADSSFVTDNSASGSGMALGLMKVYSSHEKVANKRELTITKDLQDFHEKASDRPRLVLRSRNMRPAFFVRVTLNNEWSLEMRNTKESVPPELYLWDRDASKKIAESEDYKKSVNFISLSFPKTMLRKGENKFHVKLVTYPGYRTANWIQLRELRLYEQ